MTTRRYTVLCFAITPEKALVAKPARAGTAPKPGDTTPGIYIPARRVVYFLGGNKALADLTANEAMELGYEVGHASARSEKRH